MRKIDDILHFRQDISPFLVHLTRATARTAHDALHQIVSEGQLCPGPTQVSDARFGMKTVHLSNADLFRFFGAVCLTETPLSEVHCLLEISYRAINLQPYGLVFLKDKLCRKGVSPVIYLNNELGDKDPVAAAICGLIETSPEAAEELLPLISVFGQKLRAPDASPQVGRVDFRWEREWRFPSARGPLAFTPDDVFVGLCPDEEIAEFEAAYPLVNFIDPRRNMKWYATKLIDARQRLDLKDSVV